MIAAIYNYLSKNKSVLPVLIIALTLATLGLTLFPINELVPSGIWSYDKIGHLLIFGSWTYLLGLYQLIYHPGKYSMFTIFIIGVSFGVAVEVLQFALPINRSAELFDIAFDSLGSFLAILFLPKSLNGLQSNNQEQNT